MLNDCLRQKSRISGIFKQSVLWHKYTVFKLSNNVCSQMRRYRKRMHKVHRIPHPAQLPILGVSVFYTIPPEMAWIKLE